MNLVVEKRTRIEKRKVLDEHLLLGKLLDLYPSGIFSVVSDTFDIWHLLTVILPEYKDRITSRNGKIVCRPDSGNPVDIICGKPLSDSPPETPEEKGVCELLWDVFGGTVNDKGYKELDPHVGMIYGDSINYDRAVEMCERLEAKGFASTNIVLGIGSFSYQYVTRDTYGFAMKATWAEINGEGHDLFKDPVTDDGVKKSAKGRLAVLRDDTGELQVVNQATPAVEAESLLEPVWENGEFIRKQSFADVRATLKAQG